MSEPLVASDMTLLDLLRIREAMTVVDLAEAMEVTATAIRQRLTRLMAGGYIDRSTVSRGRGRPLHSYRLTSKGKKKTGTNFADLAIALWDEIRSIDDPEIKRGLLSRLSQRLAGLYSNQVTGETLKERMQAIQDIFSDRQLPMAVELKVEETGNDTTTEGLPVLSIWACPYPDLAEKDRGICSLERMMFSELLKTDIRLEQCRLDGAPCCSFGASKN